MEVMEDPANTVDGQTYERYAIQAWFNQGKATSPMTNEALPDLRLIPARAVKSMISEFLDEARDVAAALGDERDEVKS